MCFFWKICNKLYYSFAGNSSHSVCWIQNIIFRIIMPKIFLIVSQKISLNGNFYEKFVEDYVPNPAFIFVDKLWCCSFRFESIQFTQNKMHSYAGIRFYIIQNVIFVLLQLRRYLTLLESWIHRHFLRCTRTFSNTTNHAKATLLSYHYHYH